VTLTSKKSSDWMIGFSCCRFFGTGNEYRDDEKDLCYGVSDWLEFPDPSIRFDFGDDVLKSSGAGVATEIVANDKFQLQPTCPRGRFLAVA